MTYCRPVTTVLSVLILLFCLNPLRGAKPDANKTDDPSNNVEKSVVKVFTTARYPDMQRPWSRQPPAEVSGSGVVIKGKRILTNAHVVDYASQVQVQSNESGDKYLAKVEAISHAMDLAILKVDDEKFFDGRTPLPMLDRLPKVKDSVLVYGFPVGGNNLSITKGIVSRIEFVPYNNFVPGLRIQIDAAINPGNSGGPAVADGKMIGLAFSRLNQSENIGYIIPVEEIELFLNDITDGKYDGKYAFYDTFQTLENPALRPFLKIDENLKGLIVSKPYSDDPDYPLKTWDIITMIGETPLDNQGMIQLADDVRVNKGYLVQKYVKDGKLPMTIVREGKPLKIELPMPRGWAQVLGTLSGSYPSYFIYGPLVFTKGTAEIVSIPMSTGLHAAFAYSGSPLINRLGDKPAFPGEELVVVSSPLFPHSLSKDYSNPAFQVVKSVNGIQVKNLSHLVEILRDTKDEFVTFEFDSRMGAEIIVFNRAQAIKSTEEILTDNGIRSQGSPDTLSVWETKK